MRWGRAPAKLNLTLRVLQVRPDGYHEIESLVAFGGICDWLGFEPGSPLGLTVEGPNAKDTGPLGDNLVLRAARALESRAPGLTLGRFRLVKRLPAAAGLGGGSADAAAALRRLAEANGLAPDDPRVGEAAAETGADVPVCLNPRVREMSGVGDVVGPTLRLPPLFAVLANPQVAAPTGAVFKTYDSDPRPTAEGGARFAADALVPVEAVEASNNDLEAAARKVAPAIGETLAALARLPKARLVRMSGSGATCFALFSEPQAAALGAIRILEEQPQWWAAATALR